MKRLVAACFAVALVLSIVPDAEAMRKIGFCVNWYGDDGEVCRQECNYYDDQGHFIGSVTVDYGC